MNLSNNNLIPFTIEKWREGYQPVTREGIEVKDLTFFENATDAYKLYGILKESIEAWEEKGNFYDDCSFSKNDLLLKPKTKKVYIGVLADNIQNNSYDTTRAYISHEAATEASHGLSKMKIYELEIEVE